VAVDSRTRSVALADPADTLTSRVVIEQVRPSVDGGRFPAKRTVGDRIEIRADIFADGHDAIVAAVKTRARPAADESPVRAAAADWIETPMTRLPDRDDEWLATITVNTIGWYEFAVVAWVDRFQTWRRDLQVRGDAGQNLATEFREGAQLVAEAAARANQIGTGTGDGNWLSTQAAILQAEAPAAELLQTALADELQRLMLEYADRSHATTSAVFPVWVDRERARFGSWYELFPRSAGPDAARSGTFREAAALLPRIADLGFDVVYLPPVHPIGTSFRKGRNNALVSESGDPGSPWAIGSAAGGHTAVEPGLGTLDDFAAFRAEAERLGLEVALDLAFQCSPDHPWVREHPDWFRHRADGTIRFAENPPKKYHDIYPLDFGAADWRGLWQALLDVTQFWVARGVRIFRVDNPHTKTFAFWEWLINHVHAANPEVIFLSEAFTSPKRMRYLAKSGFTQSYTYFTWRNTKSELTDYFTELTAPDVREYLRPNLFANTPDILHAYLQHGGPPAFEARLLLAATLGANYGIYSGFELCEGRAVPGTEEYLNSEKYEFRKWDTSVPGIQELVARVNAIRHTERALQFDDTLRFHDTDNPQIVAYSKRQEAPELKLGPPYITAGPPHITAGPTYIYVVVNLDPHHMQHGFVRLPQELALQPDDLFIVHDLLDEATYSWRGEWNYVRFDPGVRQGHILKLEVRTKNLEVRSERLNV